MKRLLPFLTILAMPALALAAVHGAAPAGAEAAVGHEAAAGHEAATPFAGTIAQSIAAIVVFTVVAVVLRAKAWGPILQGLTSREAKIRADLEAAENARIAGERALSDYRTQISNADAQVREKLAVAQRDAELIATRLKMDAQKEIEDMKARATREIEEQKNVALAEVRQHAAALSTSVAGKILKRQINEADQADLIRSSLEELQTAGRR